MGKTSHCLYLYASISPKRYEMRPKLLLMANRKLHMRFRLAPRSRSMTLDDLELENNLFSSFRRQYVANTTHHCRALTFALARLSCFFQYTNALLVTSETSSSPNFYSASKLSAVLAIVNPSVCPTVRPSVRPSHAGTVSKRLQLR